MVVLAFLLPLAAGAQVWPAGGDVAVGEKDGLRYRLHCAGSEPRVLMGQDSNGVDVCRIPLPGLEDCDPLSATLADGAVSLLMVDSMSVGRTLVLRVVVDLATEDDGLGAEVSVDTLERYDYGAGDRCMVWGAGSPNGGRHAVVTVVQYPETMQYSARTTLYDERMETLWQQEYAMGSLSQVAVNDEGLVVTLGVEHDEDVEVLVYNIVNQRRKETYAVRVGCAPLRYLCLVGLVGSHAMGVGTFTVSGFEGAERVTGGVTGFSFDTDSILLTGFTQRWFQNEDVNVLYNQHRRTIQREQLADFVKIAGATLTPYGMSVALTRAWREAEETDFGREDVTYHSVGLNCATFDTLGHIGHVRNIRRNAESADEWRLAVEVGCEDDGMTLTFDERRKDPVDYIIIRPTKVTKLPGRNREVTYKVAADGTVEKRVR